MRPKKIPTTSAVNVGEYIDFFTQIREEHPDCVIMHLAYSSLASSTYQNAEIAIREFEDIYLIDTRNVSGGVLHILQKHMRSFRRKKILSLTIKHWLMKLNPGTRKSSVPSFLEIWTI